MDAWSTPYGIKCNINSIIDMFVDFHKLSISFTLNRIDYGKAFDIKPGRYRVAIGMNGSFHKLALLHYE